jgi:hypothetical protein
VTKLYETLTPHERFVLTVEAMARKDDVEADRLADSCPRKVYRVEDAEFRDRIRRAYAIAMTVCLNMREGMAQIRMAKTFRQVHKSFSGPVAKLAEVALLYGRDYGRWEAGAIDTVDLPDQATVTAELATRPDLRQQLADVREIAGEATLMIADTLQYAVGQAVAIDLLSQWEGFGRFCRETLGAEPMTVTTAFGLGRADVAAEVAAAFSGATADEAEAQRWAAEWTGSWGRRFA